MKKSAYQGMERLFPLIGGGPLHDCRYGFCTTGEPPCCHIRLSFNEDSPFGRFGIEPELIVTTVRETVDESGAVRYEGKTYSFPSLSDPDEKGTGWLFQIQDKEMLEVIGADYIKAVALWKGGRMVLDLYRDSPNTWMNFFRAGVAECINGVKGSDELKDFCVSYLQAWMGNRLSRLCDISHRMAEEMASALESPEAAFEKSVKMIDSE